MAMIRFQKQGHMQKLRREKHELKDCNEEQKKLLEESVEEMVKGKMLENLQNARQVWTLHKEEKLRDIWRTICRTCR